jgi:glycerophosphoryl diester phosphodiesterase
MRILFLAALFAAGCASSGEPAVTRNWSTLDGRAPIVIAHRGASGHLPEHTLEAYALAIDQGADVVEPDLVFTKDGVLVARHDRYLSTTTNVADRPEFAARKRRNNDATDSEHKDRDDWWVEDFTLAELKTLRARQPFPGRSKANDDQFEIPTFDEMLALVARKSDEAGRPVGVYPETKHPAFFASIGHDFEAPVLKALADFKSGPVFIQSFEPEILKRLKGRADAKLVQLVYEETPGAGPNISLDEIAKYADGVGPSKALILREEYGEPYFVDEAHRLDLLVHPWTFRNDATDSNAIYTMKQRAVCEDFELPKSECESVMVSKMAYLVTEEFGDTPVQALEELHYMFVYGVDGVFGDFPDTAVKVRARIGLHEK